MEKEKEINGLKMGKERREKIEEIRIVGEIRKKIEEKIEIRGLKWRIKLKGRKVVELSVKIEVMDERINREINIEEIGRKDIVISIGKGEEKIIEKKKIKEMENDKKRMENLLNEDKIEIIEIEVIEERNVELNIDIEIVGMRIEKIKWRERKEKNEEGEEKWKWVLKIKKEDIEVKMIENEVRSDEIIEIIKSSEEWIDKFEDILDKMVRKVMVKKERKEIGWVNKREEGEIIKKNKILKIIEEKKRRSKREEVNGMSGKVEKVVKDKEDLRIEKED